MLGHALSSQSRLPGAFLVLAIPTERGMVQLRACLPRRKPRAVWAAPTGVNVSGFHSAPVSLLNHIHSAMDLARKLGAIPLLAAAHLRDWPEYSKKQHLSANVLKGIAVTLRAMGTHLGSGENSTQERQFIGAAYHVSMDNDEGFPTRTTHHTITTKSSDALFHRSYFFPVLRVCT